MPRNGSGVYGPPAGTAAVPNTPIESAKYNAFVNDISEAMTNSVNVNGTAPFQAHQPMGGFKHTNLGAGSATGDSVNLGQAQSNIIAHAASVGGTADAITAAFSPVFTAWAAKMRFRFAAQGANTVTNPTLNVDGLGAKTVRKLNSQALAVGDIAGPGHVCDCVYDGTDVLLLNPSAGNRTGVIEFIIDNGTATITTGIKGELEIPFACTITQVTLLADQSGSIVVDIWKDSYANYPPIAADSITASAKPTISSATKSKDSTLTGWTTAIAAGDILRFNVDSVTSIQRVAISLRVTKA